MLNKRPVSLLASSSIPTRHDDEDDLEYSENPFEDRR